MKSIKFLLAAVICSAFSAATMADVYVIGHPSITDELKRKDIVFLYTGRSRLLPNGEEAVLAEYPQGSKERSFFLEKVVKRSESQVAQNRRKAMVQGKMKEPSSVDMPSDMIAFVNANENAIGYISEEHFQDGLNVLYTIKE